MTPTEAATAAATEAAKTLGVVPSLIRDAVLGRIAWSAAHPEAASVFHRTLADSLPRWRRLARAWHRALARRWHARWLAVRAAAKEKDA